METHLHIGSRGPPLAPSCMRACRGPWARAVHAWAVPGSAMTPLPLSPRRLHAGRRLAGWRRAPHVLALPLAAQELFELRKKVKTRQDVKSHLFVHTKHRIAQLQSLLTQRQL